VPGWPGVAVAWSMVLEGRAGVGRAVGSRFRVGYCCRAGVGGRVVGVAHGRGRAHTWTKFRAGRSGDSLDRCRSVVGQGGPTLWQLEPSSGVQWSGACGRVVGESVTFEVGVAVIGGEGARLIRAGPRRSGFQRTVGM